MAVVCFDLRLGAVHSKIWSISAFSHFLHAFINFWCKNEDFLSQGSREVANVKLCAQVAHTRIFVLASIKEYTLFASLFIILASKSWNNMLKMEKFDFD